MIACTSSKPAPASPTELEELRYQRAAEYGAQVLARAARMLDGLPTPAYLVFTSDHGENLPSDHNGKRFHAGPVNSRPDTLVPALVLWNRAFAQSGRQHRLEALQGTALITHHDLARAWLALLGAPGRLTPATADVLAVLLGAGDALWGLRIVNETGRPAGSVYPILERLERAGWLTSAWEDDPTRSGPRRRLYRLTADGVPAARDAVPAVAGGTLRW